MRFELFIHTKAGRGIRQLPEDRGGQLGDVSGIRPHFQNTIPVNGYTYTAIETKETIVLDDMHKCAQHALGGIGSTCL